MNNYGRAFYALIQRYNGDELLKREEVLPDYYCYRDDFSEELLLEIIRLSKEKARFVSRRNQRGIERTQSEIETNVFKGVIAETVAQIFLSKICNLGDETVKRFDLERTDFSYDPNKEYDVGLFRNGQLKSEIGVKSSKISHDKFKSFLRNQHCIIGKYRYNGRIDDHNSSFYFGIVIVYEHEYNAETFIDDYLRGDVHTYIVSGATFSEMTGPHCTNNIIMNQPGTRYNLGLRSIYAGDADDCMEKVIRLTQRNI